MNKLLSNDTIIIESPNKSIKLETFLSQQTLNYCVYYCGEKVVEKSKLGLVTSVADFSKEIIISNITDISCFNDKYTLISAKKSKCDNSYNECTVDVLKADKILSVKMRVYNDGIAFSYLMNNDADFEIIKETTNYNISATATVWHNNCYKENYEFQYLEDKITALSSNDDYKFIQMPVLVKLNNGAYLQICESNLNGGYSGSMLIPHNAENTIQLNTSFVKSQNHNIKASAVFISPWRYIVIGNESEIVENTMATNLADKPDENIDYSFVKAGSTSWSWLDNERNITMSGKEYQRNTDSIKNHIDLSCEMNWDYYIMDEGWQPESKAKDENYCGYYDDFADWKEYADKKGVKLIAWCCSSDLNTKEKLKRLSDWKAHGIAGIKVDFFDCENQKTLQLYESIYKECAKNKLLVIVHGANKSSGEERTHPNVLTREGIYGQEQGNIPAKNSVVCAFTRYSVGNTDYTEYLLPRKDNVKIGFQLAMSFIYTSGMHCFADGVNNYRQSEAAQTLLKNFPTHYDETKYIAGSPSTFVSIVRRTGTTWYGAGISNIDTTQEISFDFLDHKSKYKITVYTDGKDYLTLEKSEKVLTYIDSLTVNISENGGYVITAEIEI